MALPSLRTTEQNHEVTDLTRVGIWTLRKGAPVDQVLMKMMSVLVRGISQTDWRRKRQLSVPSLPSAPTNTHLLKSPGMSSAQWSKVSTDPSVLVKTPASNRLLLPIQAPAPIRAARLAVPKSLTVSRRPPSARQADWAASQDLSVSMYLTQVCPSALYPARNPLTLVRLRQVEPSLLRMWSASH